MRNKNPAQKEKIEGHDTPCPLSVFRVWPFNAARRDLRGEEQAPERSGPHPKVQTSLSRRHQSYAAARQRCDLRLRGPTSRGCLLPRSPAARAA